MCIGQFRDRYFPHRSFPHGFFPSRSFPRYVFSPLVFSPLGLFTARSFPRRIFPCRIFPHRFLFFELRRKNNEAGNSLNAVEREPFPTRVLNPNASEASYKPKQRNYRKTKLKKTGGERPAGKNRGEKT